MKTKNVVIAVVFLILGSFSLELSAQENIKTVIKKCENMESATVSVIRERNKETKKITKTITSINLKSNPALEKEFLAAFQKDREMADQEIENKSGGKTTNLFYRFGKTSYSYDSNKNDNINISVIGEGE